MNSLGIARIFAHLRPLTAAIIYCGGIAMYSLANHADAQELVIPVWPDVAPGSEDETVQEVFEKDPQGLELVRNVVRPTLTAYLPEKAKATGAAVIIAPGGAFRVLAWRHEGTQVAEWFQARGVVAFVLKYRLLNLTDQESKAMAEKVSALANTPDNEGKSVANGKDDGDAKIIAVLKLMEDSIQLACADGREALGLLRRRAAEWGIAPDRIGILGFSAGALVATQAALKYDADTRPNFAAAIYGPPMPDVSVPADAPPLFILCAADDLLSSSWSSQLYSLWKAASRPVELHIYSKGGHGFGMNKQGAPVDSWIDRFGEWFEAQGLLASPPPEVAAPADGSTGLTGTWKVHVESALGSGSPTFTFKQEGEKLIGKYQGSFGESPLTGAVKEGEFEFSFSVHAAGSDETFVYSGTVEGNSIKGEVKLGGYGSGTFTGRRE